MYQKRVVTWRGNAHCITGLYEGNIRWSLVNSPQNGTAMRTFCSFLSFFLFLFLFFFSFFFFLGGGGGWRRGCCHVHVMKICSFAARCLCDLYRGWPDLHISGKLLWRLAVWSVREITKSNSTFSATNISSNLVWLFQLHDTIQMKSNYTWVW